MKRTYLMLLVVVSLVGCDGVGDVPYNAQSPAARISESRVINTNTPAASNRVIVVPVVAGDPETAEYLSFSDVRVDVHDNVEQKTVSVYSTVSLKRIAWRVALIKDGKEIFHFTTSNRPHSFTEAIPLEPLALEPSLPIPDRIVVTRLKAEGN